MNLYDLFETDADDRYEDGRKFWADISPHYKGWSKIEWAPTFSSWPPSKAELNLADQQIRQHPEWIAGWAYVGWRNWNQPEFTFFRNERIMTFYNVPTIGKIRDEKAFPDRGILSFDLDGNMLPPKKNDYSRYYVLLPSAVQACQNVVRIEGAKIKSKLEWITGRYYIRFGRWRENERSAIFGGAGGHELGVSAYHALYDLDEDRWEIETSVSEASISGTLQSLIYDQNKRIFLVQGNELETTGSDDEPLLHNVKIIKELKMGDVYVPGIFDPREDMDN